MSELSENSKTKKLLIFFMVHKQHSKGSKREMQAKTEKLKANKQIKTHRHTQINAVIQHYMLAGLVLSFKTET